MKIESLVIAFVIGLTLAVFADIRIVENSADGFSAEFVPPPVKSMPYNNGEFMEIALEGAGIEGAVGGPCLPVYRYLIELPRTGEFEISIESSGEKAEGLSAPPKPRQPPRFKNRPAPAFIYDPKLYETVEHKPAVEIDELGILRGHRMGELVIRPVAYDPAREAILVRENISFSVKYSEPIEPVPDRLRSRWVSETLSRSLFAPTDVPPFTDVPSHYLILTHSFFAGELGDFIEYKEQQGYDITLAVVDSIGATDTAIRDFIEDAYLTWEYPPDYLLIVGDVDRVPAHEYSTGFFSHPSDQYYVMVDGPDYFPDIACGRFSVESIAELNAIVEKTIYHGHCDFTSTDWLRRVILPACGTDGDYDLAMATQRYVVDNYCHPPDFEPDTVFAYYGATGADLIASINLGAAVVDYSGHGEETGWNNPAVSSSDIPSLTNIGKYPLVISNACLTNKFDHDSPCFGEAWIREADKGAVAFIAGSNSTLWDEDDWWERAVFDAVFLDNYYSAASLMFRGCLEVELRGSSEAEYYFQIYHVLGDPSLSFYWGEPENIAATVPDFLPLGPGEFDIPAPESTIVAVRMASGPKGAAYSIAGNAHIDVEPDPIVPDSASVTYWLPNFYRPIWANLPVVTLADVTIIPESLVVSVPGSVMVSVRDTTGGPYEGVSVVLEGFALCETLITDASGEVMFSLTPAYGETLTVTGYNALLWTIFIEKVPVIGGSPFEPTFVNVWSPAAHVTDSLPVGLDGNIQFAMPSYPCDWRISGAGIADTSGTASDSVTVTVEPTCSGTVVLRTARDGYAVGRTDIRAAYCRGNFYGVVTDTSGFIPACGVELSLYLSGADTSTEAPRTVVTTDTTGYFDSETPVICAEYDIYFHGFGWRDTLIEYTHRIDGDYSFEIEPSPTTNFVVEIYDSTASPAYAELLLFHPDGFLIERKLAETPGVCVFENVPYFDYELYAFARGCSRYHSTVSVTGSDTINIALETAIANALLIDHEGGSATDSIDWLLLFELGLSVHRVDYIPPLDSLYKYEFVIYSCGDNEGWDVFVPAHAESLYIAHKNGVKLLFEGGELAWEYSRRAPEIILDSLMMFESWVGDDPGDFILNLEPPGAYRLAHNPGTPSRGIITRDVDPWTDYFYYDMVMPALSEPFYTVGMSPHSCITYYADSLCGGFGRVAHFFFKFDDALLTVGAKNDLLANVVEWLRPPDFEHGVLLAQVEVPLGDPSEIAVAGGGDTDTTQIDGRFRIQSAPGIFDIDFSAPHIEDSTVTGITLSPGEIRTGDIFTLRVFGDIDETPKPEQFALLGIKPNPFNGRVGFDIRAPERCRIELIIYDIVGHKVCSEECEIDGRSNVIWDTRENNELPSGIYLYRLLIDTKDYRGKVILVK